MLFICWYSSLLPLSLSDRQTAIHSCRLILKICSFPDQLLTIFLPDPQVWQAIPSFMPFRALCPQSVGQSNPSMCSSIQPPCIFSTRWCTLGWGGWGTETTPHPLGSPAPNSRVYSKSLKNECWVDDWFWNWHLLQGIVLIYSISSLCNTVLYRPLSFVKFLKYSSAVQSHLISVWICRAWESICHSSSLSHSE